MVRNFRGQVKVSDVKEEFDNLVTNINNMVDSYNDALEAEGQIDYTKGSATVAPVGYTLTIGGLKELLQTYNNSVFGANVYKIASDTYYVTNGLIIKDNKPIRLNQGLITGNGDILYYDLTHEAYTFGDKYTTGNASTITIVSKDFEMPTFTNNTTWGSLSNQFSSKLAVDKNIELPLYKTLSGSVGYAAATSFGPLYTMFEWAFLEPLEIETISFQFSTSGATSQIRIEDLDGNVLSNDAVDPKSSISGTVVYSPSTKPTVNGIRVRYQSASSSNLIWLAYFGNFKMSAKTKSKIYIPDDVSGDVDKNNLVKIADLNTNRISPLCNTPNFVAEKIPEFVLGSKSCMVGYGDTSVSALKNSEKGQFISTDRESILDQTKTTSFLGETIHYVRRVGKGLYCDYVPIRRFFLPKGIPNPFSGHSWQICLDYNITRQKFKQT